MGASIILHLLILAVVVSESTDPLGLDGNPRIKPLIVTLQEEVPTQTPPLAPTTNTNEHHLQHGYPGARSPATSNMEAGIRQKESGTAGRLEQHIVTQVEPLETPQKEPTMPETNQERTAMPNIGDAPKKDLYSLAHDFIQQEAREEALSKSRQNELWRQAPSIMRPPPPPITDKSDEPEEPKSVFSDALKAAMKESQEYVIALPLSKKCVFGIKRFNREQAERRAQTGSTTPGVDQGVDILGLHCKN